MILGIDASNIRSGGGVTHVVELLRAATPLAHGFSQVIVWSGQTTLNKIEERPWLVKSHQRLLDKNLLCRTFWQRFRLSSLARLAGCDVLFVLGGSYGGDFRPIVAFNQNLLPFEWHELRRYGWSWLSLKFILLHIIQTNTFRHADGLIFLTQYAHNVVTRAIKTINGNTMIIPHGIDERFLCPPRVQLPIDHYSVDKPFRILYVSHIDLYKHQWHVVEAMGLLRASGLAVTLDLIGPAYSPALNRLRKKLNQIDPTREIVQYLGAVPYEELHIRYTQADLFLFASSCETFGQILTEAMLAGLPIACSHRSAMPELLGNSGMYFDPENPQDIARVVQELIKSPELRSQMAKTSFQRAQVYSWKRCAKETFEFLSEITEKRIPKNTR